MTNRFDKSRLPSRHVSVGPERAPHRSDYYAMGIPEEDIAKPIGGIASAGNDSAPCSTTLDFQADAAREGVIANGGIDCDVFLADFSGAPVRRLDTLLAPAITKMGPHYIERPAQIHGGRTARQQRLVSLIE